MKPGFILTFIEGSYFYEVTNSCNRYPSITINLNADENVA